MDIHEFKNITVFGGNSKWNDDEVRKCLLAADPNGLHIELGVYKGISIRRFAMMFPKRHFYGFDTFKGVKETWEYSQEYRYKMNIRFSDGGFKHNYPNISLVKGKFQDTLPDWLKENGRDISFLHMDADIYTSSIYSLKILNDYIKPGCVIRFDELCDWKIIGYDRTPPPRSLRYLPYTNWENGEWKALNEWLEECNRIVRPMFRNNRQAATVKVIQ